MTRRALPISLAVVPTAVRCAFDLSPCLLWRHRVAAMIVVAVVFAILGINLSA